MTDFSWTQDRDKCCELFSRYTALRKATQTFMSERFYKKISARDMESAADRLEIDTHGKAFVFDSENDMTIMFDYALFLNDANGGPVVQRESPKLAKGADAATRELLEVFSNYRYTWLIPINAVPGIGVRCLDLLLGEDVFVVDRGMGSYMRMDGHVTMTGLLPVGDCFMTTGAALPYHGTNADMLPMLDAVGASPHTPITLTVAQRADFAAWSIVTARAFGEMDRVRYA